MESILLLIICPSVWNHFSIRFTVQMIDHKESSDGRHDGLAAVKAFLLFNMWHISRNIRVWIKYAAPMKLRLFVERVQYNHGKSDKSCDCTDYSDSIPKLKSQNDNMRVADFRNVLISNRLVDMVSALLLLTKLHSRNNYPCST